jgi:hypothetical protein
MALVVILGLQRGLSLCFPGTPVVQTQGNFPASTTSWSEYFNFSTHPRSVGVVCTPSGMHESTIVASGLSAGDRTMGCFPFPLGCWLEVPTSICLLSIRFWLTGDVFHQTLLLLHRSCSGWFGCCSLCACMVASPFVCWDPSVVTVLCGFPASSAV